MDIGQIGAQEQSPVSDKADVTGAGNSDMGKDQFLELLVAQMQNQDPINPMDGKEFASQLAQFNSVEQLIGVNDSLSSLQESQEMMRSEMTNSMASSLTGKKVRVLSNQVNLEAGENADINYELNNSADEVEIVVKDASGSEVRREALTGVGSGENSWAWDGQTNDGTRAAEGSHSVEINATNGDKSVEHRMFTEGVANRVRFTGNGVRISIGGIEVPIGNIESVEQSK